MLFAKFVFDFLADAFLVTQIKMCLKSVYRLLNQVRMPNLKATHIKLK